MTTLIAEARAKAALSPEGMRYPIAEWMDEPRRTGKRPKVLIIGSGLAGLMAGAALAKRFVVWLFEARQRIGGRVWTRKDVVPRRQIEAGAELIGYNHPTWVYLARRFKLGLTTITGDDDYTRMGLAMPLWLIDDQGNNFDATDRAHDIYKQMDKEFYRLGDEARASLGGDSASNSAFVYAPWRAPRARELDHRTVGQWIRSLNVDDDTRSAMNAHFENDHGAPVDEQSLLAILAQVAGGAIGSDVVDDYFRLTETVRCTQGNEALVSKLKGFIDDHGGKVFPNAPVTDVRRVSRGIEIRRRDRTTHGGEYAVLAVPAKVLPRIRVDLDVPALASAETIKYLSPADDRFWLEQEKAPKGVGAACGLSWEGTDNQSTVGDVVLSLFAGGSAARAALGAVDVHRFYDEAIGRLYPTYPNNSHQRDRKFIAWPKMPWIMSGYSCPAPGDVLRAEDFFTMLHQQAIAFAGEHTCRPFFGYMEGALQSGCHAAKLVRDADR